MILEFLFIEAPYVLTVITGIKAELDFPQKIQVSTLRSTPNRSQYDLARFHPNFEEEHPVGVQGPPTCLTLPPSSREDLRIDGYLEYPYALKALYIYKHTSMPSPRI
ncbi:hypothetical protein TNCV_2747811 [Trichonephila clavipes]|nr:hypothetical protein TNCV_2747811 [Trichonephila clavipes]